MAVTAGLAALLGANYYLRAHLERSDEYLYNFYRYFYPEAERVIFGPDFPAWRRLLPFEDMTGSWSPTVLVLAHYLSDWIGPARTWYLANAAVILVSFGVSWSVFRSRVFSFTLAICMGFGTYLYYVYPNSGLIAFPLFLCYLQVLLLCIYRVVMAETRRVAWVAAFAAALLVTALAYETWLDFLVFVWLGTAVCGTLLWRQGDRVRLRRLLAVCAAMTAVGAAYVYVKITLGYGQQRGMESDLVFNYPVLAPAVEDVIANLFLNLYMALTVFLPPMFVSSWAFYQYGGDRLVEWQHGYHAPFAYLVPMQAMFLWRFYAGAAAALFVVAGVRAWRAAWQAPTPLRVALLVFMVMIATGGPTHAFIKARPLNSMAVQTYHVLTAVLGVSLSIALLVTLAWRRWPRLRTGGLVVALVWGTIGYAALARPGLIAHQAAQSGLGVRVYPDPMAALKTKLGLPVSEPAGLRLYQLERHDPDRAAAGRVGEVFVPGFGVQLPPLPAEAPPLSAWGAGSATRVEQVGTGWLVHGDDTDMGYQLVSPAIAVPPAARVLVRVRGAQEAGRACLGVLSGDETRWLLAPSPDRFEHAVETGSESQVRLVFANCLADNAVREPTRFRIESVTLGLVTGLEVEIQ